MSGGLISITRDDGTIADVGSRVLMAFLDETGHEELADARNPMFGLGGVAVLSDDYATLIDTDWRRLRFKWKGSESSVLHASDWRDFGQPFAEDIGAFFHGRRFGRLSTILTTSTSIEVPVGTYQLAAEMTLARLAKLGTSLRAQAVVILMEASQRTDRLAMRFLGTKSYRYSKDGHQTTGPIQTMLVDKSRAICGVEVADFALHAAAGKARARLTGKSLQRADFDAVFKSVPIELSESAEVLRALDIAQAGAHGEQADI
jgi:hypothetical protein